jgi:DNA-binding protein HU-beta
MKNSKADLVRFVEQKVDCGANGAQPAVDAVLEGILHLTSNGEMLILRGFGTFQLRTRRASVTRNPYSGEPIDVPSTTRLKFRQAKRAGS